MRHYEGTGLTINQTGNGDPPPKKPPTDPARVPAEPVDDTDVQPKNPKK